MSFWASNRYNFSWAKACDPEFKRDTAIAQECTNITTVLRSYFSNPKTQIEVCAVKAGSMWDVTFVTFDHNRRSSSVSEVLGLFPKTPNSRTVRDVTVLDDNKMCVSFEIPVTNSVTAPEVYEAEVRRSQSRRPRSRSRSSSPSHRRGKSSRRSPSPDRRRRSASPDDRRRRDASPRRDESPRRRGDSPETPGVARRALSFLLGH
jgi:hypothetical protein